MPPPHERVIRRWATAVQGSVGSFFSHFFHVVLTRTSHAKPVRCSTPQLLSPMMQIVWLLTSFAEKFRWCNMHLERLLALCKAASPGKTVELERYCCAGYLTHMLQEHAAMGGIHPGSGICTLHGNHRVIGELRGITRCAYPSGPGRRRAETGTKNKTN